ncbi:flagellar biosynthetic protein FliQ [Seohaeicola zhoushanensis]|uniref:Flagellar biosynthesis protein FliQ n=1 Tax=Seohaeicola zhoushanensis TaxID=1569283 RepID=A0A8J3M5D8_9RHOB|nr:flagellar biosynthetic protein FliQ [Seohaeicola zhoushanensis]GHF36024.1 flagellar biosynthesis protein FliQ [Seohaeicola zhoushanensis]
MNESDTYDILSMTFLTVLYGAGPIMLMALVVGLAIAFFQALTQVQEMTLTFVPKIAVIMVGLVVVTPLMYLVLKRLSDQVFDMLVTGGP